MTSNTGLCFRLSWFGTVVAVQFKPNAAATSWSLTGALPTILVKPTKDDSESEVSKYLNLLLAATGTSCRRVVAPRARKYHIFAGRRSFACRQ